MDVQRVTLTFDATSDRDRQLVAGCIATLACCSTSRPATHISIEADVPRRLLERLTVARAGEAD